MASRSVYFSIDTEGRARFNNRKAQQHYDELMAAIERRRREDAQMDWDDNDDTPR